MVVIPLEDINFEQAHLFGVSSEYLGSGAAICEPARMGVGIQVDRGSAKLKTVTRYAKKGANAVT